MSKHLCSCGREDCTAYDQHDTPLDTPYGFNVQVALSKHGLMVRAGPVGHLARHAWSLFDVTHLIDREPWETVEQRVQDEVEAVQKAYIEEGRRRGFDPHPGGVLLPIFDGQAVAEEVPS